MLIISKVCTVICLLCLCGNRDYPGIFQNKALSSKLFVQTNARVKWDGGSFHPIPTLPVGIESTLAIFKKKKKKFANSTFNWVSRYILFLPKLKGKKRPFLEGARRVTTLRDYRQEHLVVIRGAKVCPFLKFNIILPSFVFH